MRKPDNAKIKTRKRGKKKKEKGEKKQQRAGGVYGLYSESVISF